MTRLSEHFTLEELCLSDYAIRNGIDNAPSPEVVSNLSQLCEHSLEPLRRLIDMPIHVSSGYRSIEVNKAIGGTADSQHCLGQAADIIVPNLPVEELFQIVVKNIPFDQAIQEFGSWCHISYRAKTRGQALRAVRGEHGTIYTPGWVTK